MSTRYSCANCRRPIAWDSVFDEWFHAERDGEDAIYCTGSDGPMAEDGEDPDVVEIDILPDTTRFEGDLHRVATTRGPFETTLPFKYLREDQEDIHKLFFGEPEQQHRLRERLNTRWKYGYDPGAWKAPPLQALAYIEHDGDGTEKRVYYPGVAVDITGEQMNVRPAPRAPGLPYRPWRPYRIVPPIWQHFGTNYGSPA